MGLSWRYLASFLVLSILVVSVRPGLQASASGESFTCDAAYRLGEWSASKTPSDKPSSLQSSEFGRKVVLRLVELADPNRLIFLQSEVEAFSNAAAQNWKQFSEQRRCDGIQQWVSAQRTSGMTRLRRLMDAAPLASVVPKKLAPTDSDDRGIPWFGPFAKDEAELSARIMKYAKAIGEATSQVQLDAFDGDRRALVDFSLWRTLFAESDAEPVHLLARAFVNTLDPFSDYFSDGEYADFYRDLTGGTSGVGVKVRDLPQGLLIQHVISDSPAGKSKQIFSGDVVTKVDGVPLKGMPAQKLRHVLEGAEFSPVVLTLSKGAKGKERLVRLVRRSFAFEDERVEWRMVPLRSRKDARVGVISIPSFYGRGGNGLVGERSVAEDVEAALLKVMAKRPAAVVLDMRGNPGGYLEEAVTMGGLFLGNRPIVAVVEPTVQRLMRDHRARALYNGPLLVLVDDQSASAAEILAGALKDYQRAVVLGSPTTYGKGSVQRLFHLDSGLVELADADRQGVLKLTTSFFYSPLGHSPASGGITPHIALGKTKSQEPARPRRHQVAPERAPFIDGAMLSSLRAQESLMQSRIAALKQSSEVRADDVREVFEHAVKQAFGATKSPETGLASLAETVAVAEDLVGIEPIAAGSTQPKEAARR